MILGFKDYLYSGDIDFNSFGEINESHQYSNSIASVMDKLTFYVKRNAALESSTLNESAKRAYNKDIRLNRDERIAVSCIFNEMLNQYKKNMEEEISLYEEIINKCSVLEESVEYDIDTLSLDEGLKDKLKNLFKKGKEGLVNVTKTVIDNTKDLAVKGAEVVRAKKDELVAQAKEAVKTIEEKYTALKELIKGIIKKGIDSISKFINHILEVFNSLGDRLVDAVKKLGGLKMDKGEEPATLPGDIETEELYKNAESDGEKSFINNVILRAQTILLKDKESAEKLMTESYVNESLVDNKFIAWLAGYKNDGTKMSWWKCILIGLCASLIVWLLPKVLVIAGVGGALAMFIAALVGVVWNSIGILKLIYRRNKQRKPGEKFFNTSTAIFFALSTFSTIFSIATFVKTIGPLLQEICNYMGWTGGDDMSKFGEFIYGITKKISPKDCFTEGGLNQISEEVKNYGGDFRGNDLVQAKNDILNTVKAMPGASKENIDAIDQFLSAPMNVKGSSAVYKALEAFKDNKDLPLTAVLDTSKWGGAGPIVRAINFYKDQLPESAVLGTLGSVTTQAASHGQYGFANCLMGLNKDQVNMVLDKAAEFAGKDASLLQLRFYGAGEIASTITTTEVIKGGFNVLTPDMPFLPMVMPFFDKKKWGKYKIRFASATRGAAAYVVDRVEMLSADKIESSPAFEKLQELHNKAWAEFKALNLEDVVIEESKKDKESEKKTVEEPKYIVFYVNPDESTGKDSDKAEKKEDEKKQKEPGQGIAIDTLTMMCCDICNFNESVKTRRRAQPYFVKGLLSRISFRPKENNDNDTKEYIRQTLGQTMKTIITQNVHYGVGRKYIDVKVEKKKAEYTLRETVLGDDKTKVLPDKVLFELGNFSPNELLRCLTDESKSNKISYDFLGGDHASKVNIKKDKNGNLKCSAIKDSSTIENVRYYRVSKEEFETTMKAFEEKKKAYKEGNLPKRPAKPTFVKGDDNEYYKRASQKWMKDPENKRKKVFDFVDIRIIPLLKKGALYKTLLENDEFKRMLYKEDEENNVKLNKEVVEVLKPFLFRPEKTFAKDDEYQLSDLLKSKGVEGEKLGWWKNLFKNEKQLHDSFKDLIETIWDYLSDNRRKVFKVKDLTPTNGKKLKEGYDYIEYTVFDELLEDFYNDEYDEDTEAEYDTQILNERKQIVSYENFLIERY